jgi:UDP-glucose 4-epimerase
VDLKKTGMKEKALISGGCGFIGSYLLDLLIERGFDCAVADILHHDNYDLIAPREGQFRFFRTDIRDREALAELFGEFRPKHVFHLAAHHFIPYCNENPLTTIHTNIVGTQNVADCCEAFGAQRLFFASTAAVYGVSEAPHREDDRPDPIDIYGVSKAAGEKIVTFLAKKGSVKVKIGRYFNAVGPRETNPHIIPEIVSQLASNPSEPAVHLGNLSPKRDYIHAADIASATFRVLMDAAGDSIDTVNIGSGYQHSVGELVGKFAIALRREIRIESDEARRRQSDRPNLCADITKLRTAYNWSPKYSLESAIRELAPKAGAFTGGPAPSAKAAIA